MSCKLTFKRFSVSMADKYVECTEGVKIKSKQNKNL